MCKLGLSRATLLANKSVCDGGQCWQQLTMQETALTRMPNLALVSHRTMGSGQIHSSLLPQRLMRCVRSQESEELKEQASVSIVDAMPSSVNLLNDASPPSADQLSESSQPRRRLRSDLNEAAAAESPAKKSRRVGSPRAVSVSTLVPQAQTLSTDEQRAHMQEWFKKCLPWIRTNLLRGSRSDPRTILAKGPIHDKWQTLWKHCEMWLKGQNDNNEDSDRM